MILLFDPPLRERARRGAPPAPSSADALAVHPQGARRPECRLLVGLVPATGGPGVVRVAATAAADRHLLDLWSRYDAFDASTDVIGTPARALLEDAAGRPVLAEALVDGPSVEAEVARALDRGDVAEAARILGAYRELLDRASRPGSAADGGSFAATLGTDAPEASRWLDGAAVDLLPQNVLLGPGRPTAIDLEWAFPCAVPVEYVAARALLVLAARIGHLTATWRDRGLEVLDFGRWLFVPAALARALLPAPGAVEAWVPTVRGPERRLQAAAVWQPPGQGDREAEGEPPRRVPAHRPSPLELYGWAAVRARVERDDAELRRLEAENARLEAENGRLEHYLRFTAVGLLRRASNRWPWLKWPVRAWTAAPRTRPR